jgi:L-asparaginase
MEKVDKTKKKERIVKQNTLIECENPNSKLKNILVIQTGGTIACENSEEGLTPSKKQYLDLVPEVYNLANIDIIRTVNIDSTDMSTKEREMLAELIYKYSLHKHYDGFVIIHGTDTMVDTACALNYMIQNLGKPIILTGAQKSMFEDPVSDGRRNIFYAIKTATSNIGEICILFGDKVLRGSRAYKESEEDLNAFTSPRSPALGTIGLNLILNKKVITPRKNGEPVLFTSFNPKVAVYDQASGADSNIFNLFVESDEVAGIIIRGYGAGNIQSRLVPLTPIFTGFKYQKLG